MTLVVPPLHTWSFFCAPKGLACCSGQEQPDPGQSHKCSSLTWQAFQRPCCLPVEGQEQRSVGNLHPGHMTNLGQWLKCNNLKEGVSGMGRSGAQACWGVGMILEVSIVAFLWEGGNVIPKECLHSLASFSLSSLVSFLISGHGLRFPPWCKHQPSVLLTQQ